MQDFKAKFGCCSVSRIRCKKKTSCCGGLQRTKLFSAASGFYVELSIPSTQLAVLQSAGFTVLNTSDENTAFARNKRRTCDVLLLYYRLPEGLAERLATAFRESCPNIDVHSDHRKIHLLSSCMYASICTTDSLSVTFSRCLRPLPSVANPEPGADYKHR
jgi:hypothetical protein